MKKVYKRNQGFTLVGVMITLSIVTFLATIAIPQLLRTRMIANESAARATLKTISTALETYAAEGMQGYPTNIAILVTATPPYLNKNYIADSPFLGYNYICESLETHSYICNASPQHCAQTGSKIYTITTGGILIETDCSE
jgi:type II secretory pathway pseudopilin PulG